MIERHIKTVHYLRDVLNSLKREQETRLAALRETKLHQSYEKWDKERLDAAKKTKAAEDELRQALIDAQLIAVGNRHPAIKSVTYKSSYEYDPVAACEYALDNELGKLLTVDKRKFELYLAFLTEAGEPLPDFVKEVETVSVALVSDLSEVAK